MHLPIFFVICALLINIQAHDHVKTRHAHPAHPAVRHAQQNHKVQNRDNAGNNHTCRCQGLKFVFNSTTNIVGIYIGQAGAGLVIDINANLVVIFSNQLNISVAINLHDQSGVFVRNSNVTFDYLIQLQTLQTVYDADKNVGTSFNTSSPPEDIARQLAPLLRIFNPNCSRLSDLISNVQALVNAFRTLSRIFGSGTWSFSGNFGSFTQRFLGLLNLFGRINGGVDVVAQRNFTLDLGGLLTPTSGLAAFINVIRQLSGSFDIRQLFGSSLSSNQDLLNIIAGFSGSGRFDEVWRVISGLSSLSQNSTSANSSSLSPDLVRILVQFFASQSSNSTFGIQQWQSIIQGALGQLGNFSSNNSIPGLDNLLRGLLRPQGFSLNGIDFSRILNGLLNRHPRGFIYNIINILTAFVPQFPFRDTIRDLIVQIIYLFATPNRIFTLRNFFPNIPPSQLDTILGAWGTVLQGFITFLNVIHGVTELMAQFWQEIPFVGLFFGPINEAISLFTGGASTFLQILETPEVQRDIRAAIANFSSQGSSENGLGGVNQAIQGLEGIFGLGGSQTPPSSAGTVNPLESSTGHTTDEKHHGIKARSHKGRHHSKGKEKKHEIRHA